MLSRSKSLRFLRGGHKEPNPQDSGHLTPPAIHSQTDLNRLKGTAPVALPAERVQTPDMLQRPRTSGGSADRSNGRLFHRKAVLNPAYAGSATSLVFPSPDKPNTTILYAAEVHEDTEGIIGIALGSPTMNHPPWSVSPHGGELGTVTHISASAHEQPAPEAKQEEEKPKISRWKSVFGRKKPQLATPAQKASFYQLAQPAGPPPRADSHHDEDSVESRSISRAEEHRDQPQSASPPAFRAEIRESRRLPKGQEQSHTESRPRALTAPKTPQTKPRAALNRSATTPKPRIENTWNASPSVPQLVISGSPNALSNHHTSTPMDNAVPPMPLLDLDIPSIKFDRYSVMFGNLLQQSGNTPSSHQSSLLARRQGNAERLKPLNELSAKKGDDNSHTNLHRRATSPSLPSSPVTLTLAPNPPITLPPSPTTALSDSIHRPRPLQRSKTAPPTATSPVQSAFPVRKSSRTNLNTTTDAAPHTSNHSTQPSVSPSLSSSILSEGELTVPNRQHFRSATTDSSSGASFASSSSEEVTIIVSQDPRPWKPALEEPEWEIVKKPSPLSALRSHPAGVETGAAPLTPTVPSSRWESRPEQKPEMTRGRGQEKVVRAHTHAAKSLSQPRNRPEAEFQIATVGIARSVSVSRASPRTGVVKATLVKKMSERTLSPTSVLSPASTMTSPALSPCAPLSATPASGRFVGQRALTPQLVDVQLRNSQVVEVDDA